jgi:hypothetical protein
MEDKQKYVILRASKELQQLSALNDFMKASGLSDINDVEAIVNAVKTTVQYATGGQPETPKQK